MTDDDQRMDRARRIKQMREGRRDDASNGDGGPGETDESEWFADSDPDADTDTAEGRSTGDTAAPAGSEGQTAAESGPANDDEARAAAASAAEAAAEFEGGATEADPTAEDPLAAATGGAAVEENDAEAAGQQPAEAASQQSPETPEAKAAEVAQEIAAATAEADDDADDEAATPGARAARQRNSAAETRVLEFQLGDERYCLNITYVEEIVKEEQITRVPNTPAFVRGVVDLRGQITTILDPKESIGVEGDSDQELIVVFDGEAFEDQGHVGWVVDQVHQVTPVVTSEVKEAPTEGKHINGVIERDDEFVVWTDPEIALEEAQDDD